MPPLRTRRPRRRPDELDPPKLYNLNGAGTYHGLYVAALQLYYGWNYRSMPGCLQESETIDLQLTFSRDGKRWERLANRPIFLPRGLIGAFDGGMLSTASPPLVEYGDELRIYYTGAQYSHLVPGGTHGIGVARLPKERLVARTAGDEMGVLMTKPLVIDGDLLQINVDARRGLAKMEIADVMGNPIPEFTVHDAGESPRTDSASPRGGRTERAYASCGERPYGSGSTCCRHASIPSV